MNKLTELCRVVANQYPSDPLAAGITVAYLPKRDKWYASVVRYPVKDAKQIVSSATEATLEEALDKLVKLWMPEGEPCSTS